MVIRHKPAAPNSVIGISKSAMVLKEILNYVIVLELKSWNY
jgi:hypothetical protein